MPPTTRSQLAGQGQAGQGQRAQEQGAQEQALKEARREARKQAPKQAVSSSSVFNVAVELNEILEFVYSAVAVCDANLAAEAHRVLTLMITDNTFHQTVTDGSLAVHLHKLVLELFKNLEAWVLCHFAVREELRPTRQTRPPFFITIRAGRLKDLHAQYGDDGYYRNAIPDLKDFHFTLPLGDLMRYYQVIQASTRFSEMVVPPHEVTIDERSGEVTTFRWTIDLKNSLTKREQRFENSLWDLVTLLVDLFDP
ncbi:hypothetical protein N0V90_001648 [Kalmusia sp. IMI 367209]|nr:hypothetical protein N0V90_001648 [Kalmusia sp. IMI 367209]